MAEEKKTAIDKACEELYNFIKKENCCNSCPVCNKGCKLLVQINYENVSNTKEKCLEMIKQYFQEQADIPDGWDVIKKRIAFHKKALWDNPSPEYNEGIILELENLCEWNGIKVDNG